MKKNKAFSLAVFLIVLTISAFTIQGCKKTSLHETIDNNKDKVPEKTASHIVTPIVPGLPSVLDSLSQLTKFEDYNFNEYIRSFTEGDETIYIIPNIYFIGYEYLYVICDDEGGVTVWSLYVPDGDKGFEYYYQNNLSCDFSFYDFDSGDELVSGYGSFYDNTLTITYYNNSYFFYGDREQVPPGQNPGDPKRPWLCGMSMGLAGTIWSAAVGVASLGAGFIVSLSFTALTIWVCD